MVIEQYKSIRVYSAGECISSILWNPDIHPDIQVIRPSNEYGIYVPVGKILLRIWRWNAERIPEGAVLKVEFPGTPVPGHRFTDLQRLTREQKVDEGLLSNPDIDSFYAVEPDW